MRQPVFQKGRNEVSQTEERPAPYDLTDVWNLKMRTTKATAHSPVGARGRRGEQGKWSAEANFPVQILGAQ